MNYLFLGLLCHDFCNQSTVYASVNVSPVDRLQWLYLNGTLVKYNLFLRNETWLSWVSLWLPSSLRCRILQTTIPFAQLRPSLIPNFTPKPLIKEMFCFLSVSQFIFKEPGAARLKKLRSQNKKYKCSSFQLRAECPSVTAWNQGCRCKSQSLKAKDPEI